MSAWNFLKFILLICCLASTVSAAGNGGQTRLHDSKEAIRQHFWKELYIAGGSTLICNEAFSRKSATLSADHIYQLGWIEHFTGCSNSIECQSNDQFQVLASDLHNIFPLLKRVQLSKRESTYDLVLGESTELVDPGCDYKKLNQFFEPGDNIKGDFARAILYMHIAYDAPIIGSPNTYIRWHEMDPPSEEEKRRNDVIEKIQGNRNPLIDKPEIAKSLIVRTQ